MIFHKYTTFPNIVQEKFIFFRILERFVLFLRYIFYLYKASAENQNSGPVRKDVRDRCFYERNPPGRLTAHQRRKAELPSSLSGMGPPKTAPSAKPLPAYPRENPGEKAPLSLNFAAGPSFPQIYGFFTSRSMQKKENSPAARRRSSVPRTSTSTSTVDRPRCRTRATARMIPSP